jgi:HD-GYP domain-containing protein (c-di-GMP phosphodiesterase class II)
VERLHLGQGRHFDPQVVAAMVKVLAEHPNELAPLESSNSVLARLRRRWGQTDAFIRDSFRKFPSSF